MARRPNWLTRLLLTFYGPASHSRTDAPRTSPAMPTALCPACGKPLSLHEIARVGGKSRTVCPTDN